MTRPDATGGGRSSLGEDASDELGPGEFEAFFRGSYADLVRILVLQGAGMADAQDAAQEAFLEVYRRWGSIQNPKGYLFKAAFNRYRRSAGRQRRSIPHGLGPDGLPTVPDLSTDPSMSTFFITVQQAVSDLPAGQREVMSLSVAGYATAEIANILDTSKAAVRQSLHRARNALAARLSSEAVGWDLGREEDRRLRE